MRFGVAMAALVTWCCQALTITSTPTLTSAKIAAPLAATLAVGTDSSTFVSISVNDGVETWNRNFFDYGTNHSEILLGFKPNRTNQITITVRDAYRNSYTYPKPLSLVTGALPSTMPTMILVTNNPALMEPGYTLFRVFNVNAYAQYVMFVDNSGAVVWYGPNLATPTDVRQLTNGNLFFQNSNAKGFNEVNMLGQTVNTWTVPTNYPVNPHEDLMTDHGTILYLSSTNEMVSNFPSSTESNAPVGTADVDCQRVAEISVTNSSLLNTWSLLSMLDPARINYLCFLYPATWGIDPEHANAIIEDTNDDSIIVSLRNQDAIVKFSRAGQLKWILGPHENWGTNWEPYLLTPVGTNFAWNFAQHAPVLTPQGTLLIFDDGNCRAEPWAKAVPDPSNYSRAVEFRVDETNMTVSQVWEFTGTNDDRLYCYMVGNATLLPNTGNVLLTFGAISYENGEPVSPFSTNGATMVRLKEVTHEANPNVVFDLEFFDPDNTNADYGGYQIYRSRRVPDLYGHPAVPVPALTLQMQSGQPLLQFTADPVFSYQVQVSTNLVNWRDLGAAEADDANGEFSFLDEGSGPSTRYYRVITQ